MLEFPHILVGAAIATKIPNPLLSIPLAFLSHFPLDLIPHWNPHLYTETKKHGRPTKKSTLLVVVDVLLSLGVGLLIASRAWPNLTHVLVIILACFAAVAIDVIEGPFFFLGFRPRWLQKLIEFQHGLQGETSMIPGLVIQGATIALAIWVTFA